MWNAILCKDEQEAQAALEALMKRKLIAQAYPLSLPSVPGLTFPSIVFPQEERKEILRTLGRKDGFETATSDPKLKLVLTEPVTVLGQPGDLDDAIAETLRIYASEFEGLHILATNPHGEPYAPVEEAGVLHIRFYSTPQASSQAHTFARVFGRALPTGMCDGLMPSGTGVPLTAPEGVIAEVHGNNLYIFFDLPHPVGEEELMRDLLAQIMELFLAVRAASRGHWQEDSPEARYVYACLRRHRLRLVTLMGQRKALAQRVKAAQQIISQCQRELEEAERAFQGLEEGGQARAGEAARQEYRSLVGLPHVEQVHIQGPYLCVNTDEIYLQHAGCTYLMGRYQIRIPLDRIHPLAIVNQMPKSADETWLHHPHVSGDGTSMCLGTFAPVIQLIAEGQWALAAQLLIEFLHHVNAAQDSYINTLQTYWTPLVKPRLCSCQEIHKLKEGS